MNAKVARLYKNKVRNVGFKDLEEDVYTGELADQETFEMNMNLYADQ